MPILYVPAWVKPTVIGSLLGAAVGLAALGKDALAGMCLTGALGMASPLADRKPDDDRRPDPPK